MRERQLIGSDNWPFQRFCEAVDLERQQRGTGYTLKQFAQPDPLQRTQETQETGIPRRSVICVMVFMKSTQDGGETCDCFRRRASLKRAAKAVVPWQSLACLFAMASFIHACMFCIR
jgi:hypothetical protein